MNLENESYRPFNKSNNTPLYVHKLSNHPPSVTKNIPAGVNKLLSSISSDEQIFEMAAPLYQQALNNNGYNYQLKFDPAAAEPAKKSKHRKEKLCGLTHHSI